MNKEKLIADILSSEAKIVSPLIGGMMNESFIVENKGKKYVLYISTAQANEMVNRQLEKDSQQIVHSLGITSKNVYFDLQKGIKINEFIEGNSLDHLEKYDIKKVAEIFHILHSSKQLVSEDYHPFERFDDYEKQVDEFVKEKDQLYLAIRNKLFSFKEYLQSQKKVLCHNDAQKSNIVKSLDDKYYFIDFEFMANNDFVYDIATFGNGSVKEGFELLNEYAPNPSIDLIKRYYLWRMFVSLQWYDVALIKHYRGEGEIHHFDFLKVAEHFLNNANEAYTELKKYA